MLTIKVLGPGCSNCQKVEANTREALAELDPQLEYEIIEVTGLKGGVLPVIREAQ